VTLNAKILGIIVIALVLAGGAAYSWLYGDSDGDGTLNYLDKSPGKIDSKMGRIRIPTNGCYLGASVTGPFFTEKEFSQVKDFEKMVGKRVAILNIFWLWTESSAKGRLRYFPRDGVENYVRDGIVPMFSSWPVYVDVGTGGAEPATCQEIIDSKCDDLLTEWASQMKALSYPIFFRLGWEMNIISVGGFQYQYLGAYNFGPQGNNKWTEVDNLSKCYGDISKPDGPERFVDAWKHIHGVFSAVGAKNVLWVWCPNHRSNPNVEWNKPDSYYPGDDYVDWIGCDLYNQGYYEGSKVLSSFKDIFRKYSGYEIYRKHLNKPFILAEIGCSQEFLWGVKGDKAKWILDAYDSIRNLYPNIKAIVWFSKDKRAIGEGDWRVDSSPESLEAYRKAISDPYFLDRIMFETGGQAPPLAFPLQTGMIAIPLRAVTGRRLRV
jgi:hypothetical protein